MEVTMFSEPVSSIMYAAPTAIEESAEPASPPASPRPIESTLFSGASDNATSSVGELLFHEVSKSRYFQSYVWISN